MGPSLVKLGPMRIIISLILAMGLALPAIAKPEWWKTNWPRTDFTRHSVDYSTIIGGGPPKDGIPAIDDPSFKPANADTVVEAREPVVTLELDGQIPRAYPIRYLTWHEIVNDVIGEVPVTVTFCPLCNSALVFDGRLAGETLTFGVSGMLRNSDMIMYDRNSDSWWQQFTGEAVVGDKLGQKLTTLPSWMESYAEFKARNPQGLVMQRPPVYQRAYGFNPYAGYDSSAQPFLYRGENPPHDIPPLARVLRIGNNAWPLTRLAKVGTLTEEGVTIIWKAGMASALDGEKISTSREVGSIRVKNAKGEDIPHEVVFAFAFHAFAPDGVWHLD